VFTSNLTTPGVSFAAALRGGTQQQQPQALQVSTPERPPTKKHSVSAPVQPHQSGQSVRAQNTNSQSLDSMLRVVTVVQQIMTEIKGVVSEEEKIVAITKIVLNLMKQDGH
jgi:hypothetical protein